MTLELEGEAYNTTKAQVITKGLELHRRVMLARLKL
jgi:hypothetical protein